MQAAAWPMMIPCMIFLALPIINGGPSLLHFQCCTSVAMWFHARAVPCGNTAEASWVIELGGHFR
jgi:hypothetical protein